MIASFCWYVPQDQNRVWTLFLRNTAISPGSFWASITNTSEFTDPSTSKTWNHWDLAIGVGWDCFSILPNLSKQVRLYTSTTMEVHFMNIPLSTLSFDFDFFYFRHITNNLPYSPFSLSRGMVSPSIFYPILSFSSFPFPLIIFL
jgi:hypothetical protein